MTVLLASTVTWNARPDPSVAVDWETVKLSLPVVLTIPPCAVLAMTLGPVNACDIAVMDILVSMVMLQTAERTMCEFLLRAPDNGYNYITMERNCP